MRSIAMSRALRVSREGVQGPQNQTNTPPHPPPQGGREQNAARSEPHAIALRAGERDGVRGIGPGALVPDLHALKFRSNPALSGGSRGSKASTQVVPV